MPRPLQPGWERATLEKLAFAALDEQRAARRWSTFVRLSWLAFFVFLVWLAHARAAAASSDEPRRTRRWSRSRARSPPAPMPAPNSSWPRMRAAFEDEGAQAVVLLINSPGGSPVQAGIINDEIRRLKAKHKKPVYAVVEETCASAAYYIAAAADKIFVDKASIVGSIGVLMDGFGFTGLMDKLGVERRLHDGRREQGLPRSVQPADRDSSAPMRRPCWTRSTSSSSTWSRPAAASA